MYLTGCIFWFVIGFVLFVWAFLTFWERIKWKTIGVDFWVSIPAFFLGIWLMYLPFS